MGQPVGFSLNCHGRGAEILMEVKEDKVGTIYGVLCIQKSQEHRSSSEDEIWESPCPETQGCIEDNLGRNKKEEKIISALNIKA